MRLRFEFTKAFIGRALHELDFEKYESNKDEAALKFFYGLSEWKCDIDYVVIPRVGEFIEHADGGDFDFVSCMLDGYNTLEVKSVTHNLEENIVTCSVIPKRKMWAENGEAFNGMFYMNDYLKMFLHNYKHKSM